ncbi:DsbA family oxidoreductase [Paucibacter sp. B51]|uniref:DsbA family oxidoreductase n=1 Tax=Paucibacter sp. B51 TaxID=2993315 RepID=UPI0022EBE014|nr:DsbA family oxidoreductase [Paucibacter sp. B51]
MKTVHVELWSDFVCPWCWIAKRRLEQAAERLTGQVQVTVTHKAYRIAKGMAPNDFGAALKMKFGSEQSARQMMAAVAEQGAREGLVYNFDTMRFGDTRDAHALVKHLDSEAARQTMIEALSLASITQGRDIFDREVLRSIASQQGLSETQVAAIDFDRSREIEQDEKHANSIANGVPLFVFNNKAYLSGAQPTDMFVAALNQVATESPAPMDSAQGASCGQDGCQI